MGLGGEASSCLSSWTAGDGENRKAFRAILQYSPPTLCPIGGKQGRGFCGSPSAPFMRSPLIFGFVLLLAPLTGHAQQVSHSQYGVSEGLSSDEVAQVVCDSAGFAWIATGQGLGRYSGHRFAKYCPPGGPGGRGPPVPIGRGAGCRPRPVPAALNRPCDR